MADVLVLAASNGENLKLAERFAATARSQGSSAEVLDLTAVDLPLYSPRAQELGTPPALAALEQQLMATPRWVIRAPEYNGAVMTDRTAMLEDAATKMVDYDVRPPNPHLKCASFSGGNQQKIVLAREMSRAPEVLLIGQPTRGVDIGAIERLDQDFDCPAHLLAECIRHLVL